MDHLEKRARELTKLEKPTEPVVLNDEELDILKKCFIEGLGKKDDPRIITLARRFGIDLTNAYAGVQNNLQIIEAGIKLPGLKLLGED